MLYSWVTTHNYPTEVPVRFTSVLKKLVGVTQLYVRVVFQFDFALQDPRESIH